VLGVPSSWESSVSDSILVFRSPAHEPWWSRPDFSYPAALGALPVFASAQVDFRFTMWRSPSYYCHRHRNLVLGSDFLASSVVGLLFRSSSQNLRSSTPDFWVAGHDFWVQLSPRCCSSILIFLIACGGNRLAFELPLARVNKFSKFYWNSSKFDRFSPHQILKSMILLFTDLKY
jgi:hypothetical protein